MRLGDRKTAHDEHQVHELSPSRFPLKVPGWAASSVVAASVSHMAAASSESVKAPPGTGARDARTSTNSVQDLSNTSASPLVWYHSPHVHSPGRQTYTPWLSSVQATTVPSQLETMGGV